MAATVPEPAQVFEMEIAAVGALTRKFRHRSGTWVDRVLASIEWEKTV
jgi:hypothetical protein